MTTLQAAGPLGATACTEGVDAAVDDEVDVAIIGCGPAGLATYLALKKVDPSLRLKVRSLGRCATWTSPLVHSNQPGPPMQQPAWPCHLVAMMQI